MPNNILQNSSFNNAFANWNRTGQVELVQGSDARNNGTSAKLTAVKGEGFVYLRQFFDAQPGHSYVLSFWAKGPEHLQISYGFSYSDGTGKWVGNGVNRVLASNENESFRRYTRQCVLPTDMSSTRVCVNIGTVAVKVESGSSFFDDIEVYEQDFASDDAHPAGESYSEDQSFEKDPRCETTWGIVVDPINARTGYKAVRLIGNHSFPCALSSRATVGKAYMASFYAKAETPSTRLKVSYGYIDADGKFQYKDTPLLPTLSTSYQRFEVRFPIPLNAQRITYLYFTVYPATDDHIAWVDDCKIVESPIPFQSGNMLKTITNQVAVRTQPNLNSNNTKVATGCLLPIEGYAEGSKLNGSNRWVKVSWCTYSGGAFNVTSRYIHETVAEEVVDLNPTALDKTPKVKAIANSLVGTTGGNLNLKGEWCQTFLYWLCYVVGVDLTKIPVHCGVTKDAVEALTRNGMYKDKESNPNFLPAEGCWIYYKNVNSSDEFSHVGLITHRAGKQLTCIEGNLGKEENSDRKVQKIIIPDYTADTVVVNNVTKIIKGYGYITYR